MTGPEHYAEAERLISVVNCGGPFFGMEATETVALAQVHMTAALVCATLAVHVPNAATTRAQWSKAIQ